MLLLIFDTEEERQLAIRLYEKYSKFMFKVAYSILHNCHSAEDVVQQAFIKIADNLNKINKSNETTTRNFIGITTKNTALKIYNKEKNHIVLPIDDNYADTDSYDISDIIITKETYDRIKIHINNLKPIYKEIILIKYSQNLNDKEIAELLNITPENARKRLERARKQILKALKEDN